MSASQAVSASKNRLLYSGQFSSEPGRQIFLLSRDWDYLEKNAKNLPDHSIRSLGWTRIDLPHTWDRFDATDSEPGYRRSASWYHKEIFIPKPKQKKILRLYFEAVNICSEVYINGKLAGSHIGGYLGFTVDMTPHVRWGGINTIDVRADNSFDPDVIPSQKSDFTICGGITRDVWLQVLPSVYIDSLRVEIPKVGEASAQTLLKWVLQNSNAIVQPCRLEITLKDPKGKMIERKTIRQTLVPGFNTIIHSFRDVKNPRLWSPDKPDLYEVTVDLKGEEAGEDQVSEKIGYRWFEFLDQGPFILNGKRLLLRGTHIHEDHAGFGGAVPDSVQVQTVRSIKSIGANFVRLAHYAHDPVVYRACDELGLLVWDELAWCRGGIGGSVWKENTHRMLKEQVLQNFNHPSIIIHSVGNELDWLPDFPGGDNPDSISAFIRKLNNTAHRLDPRRVTSIRKSPEGIGAVDVFSPSIWAGWYSGIYKGYKQALTRAHEQFPRFIHMEYGGDSHVGRHTENPVTGEGKIKEDEWAEKANLLTVKNVAQSGDWSENYIVDLFDWHLHISEQLDWFTGSAQWIFKDFSTPLRPENPIPCMNQKGLCDRSGKPKDGFYVYKSYWTVDPKFCYIESHTWTERSGPRGVKRQVCVFSNCQQVELILNGVNLGRKERNIQQYPACGLNWDMDFAEGANQLVAVGYTGVKEAARDTIAVNYTYQKAGTPDRIVLSSKDMGNGNVLIEARVVDEKGQLCLDYNKRIYFAHDGDGILMRHFGTPTGSDVIEAANGRASIVLVPQNGGRDVIEARNQDFKGEYLVIQK